MRAILFALTVVAGCVGSASLAGAAVLSVSDVMERYTNLGYQILSLKLDDNVYEMKANQNGAIVELRIDSTSGALVADDEQDGVDTVDIADEETATVDSQDDDTAYDDGSNAHESGSADDDSVDNSGGADDNSGDDGGGDDDSSGDDGGGDDDSSGDDSGGDDDSSGE